MTDPIRLRARQQQNFLAERQRDIDLWTSGSDQPVIARERELVREFIIHLGHIDALEHAAPAHPTLSLAQVLLGEVLYDIDCFAETPEESLYLRGELFAWLTRQVANHYRWPFQKQQPSCQLVVFEGRERAVA